MTALACIFYFGKEILWLPIPSYQPSFQTSQVHRISFFNMSSPAKQTLDGATQPLGQSLRTLQSDQQRSCNLWKRINPMWQPLSYPGSTFKTDMEEALQSDFKEPHDFTHHRRRDGFTFFVEANARFKAMNKLQATAATGKKA
jgi:hypothetical protein